MKRPPQFSAEEFSRRLTLARGAMSQAGLDALVVSEPANIAWLTGLDAWTFTGHQAAVVTGDGPPIWWGRDGYADAARATVWMMDDRVFTYADPAPGIEEQHPVTALASLLVSGGLGSARIGVELDAPFFTAACIGALLAQAPSASYHDATGLLNWRRVVKSEPEIALLRQAARIVERGHERAFEAAAAGAPMSRLAAEISFALIDGAEDAGGAFGGGAPATPPLISAGRQGGAARLTWDDRALAVGETVVVNIAGRRRGYHCPQARTISLGAPSPAARALEAAALRALDAALAAARPGARAADVHAAYVSALGGLAPSRVGGSVGLAEAPDWSERSLRLVATETAELTPGMALEIGAPLWDGQVGLMLSETVLIGPSGAEPLCHTPREMFVKP